MLTLVSSSVVEQSNDQSRALPTGAKPPPPPPKKKNSKKSGFYFIIKRVAFSIKHGTTNTFFRGSVFVHALCAVQLHLHRHNFLGKTGRDKKQIFFVGINALYSSYIFSNLCAKFIVSTFLGGLHLSCTAVIKQTQFRKTRKS